jgi:hypothetical protein
VENVVIALPSHAARPELSFFAATFTWQPSRPASCLPMAFSFAPPHLSARAGGSDRRHRFRSRTAAAPPRDRPGPSGRPPQSCAWEHCSARRSKAVRRDKAVGARRGRLIGGGSVNQGVCGSYLPGPIGPGHRRRRTPAPIIRAARTARVTCDPAAASRARAEHASAARWAPAAPPPA